MLEPLLAALEEAKTGVRCCSQCGGFTTVGHDPCELCGDLTRDSGLLCVVEEASDILSIESTGVFRGRYHALGGKLSPAKHLGPEKLRLNELMARVREGGVREILLAVSTDMEGDATAGYVAELLRGHPVRLTRLAFGLPVDSGIAYSDALTLRRAIQNRIAQG